MPNFRSIAAKYGLIGAGAGAIGMEEEADATLIKIDKAIKGVKTFRHPITGAKVAEISDANQKLLKVGNPGDVMKYGDIIDHRELYKLRPQLADVPVIWHDADTMPYYNTPMSLIGVPSKGKSSSALKETLSDLTHEGSGHAVSHMDGLPTGSNARFFPEYALYEEAKYLSASMDAIADARKIYDSSKKTPTDRRMWEESIDNIMEFGLTDKEHNILKNSSERVLRQISAQRQQDATKFYYQVQNKYKLSTGELNAFEVENRKFLTQKELGNKGFLADSLEKMKNPNNIPYGNPITEYYTQPFNDKRYVYNGKIYPAVGAVLASTALPDTSSAAIDNYTARPEVAEQAKKEAYWKSLIEQSNREYALKYPHLVNPEEGLQNPVIDPIDAVGVGLAPMKGVAKLVTAATDAAQNAGMDFTIDNLPELLKQLQTNTPHDRSRMMLNTW